MKFKISEDGNFLQILDCTELEHEQLHSSFSKKHDSYFILKKKMPHWDGEIKFVDNFGRIPVGLWGELKKMGEKFQIPIEIENSERLIDQTFFEDDLDEWIEKHFENSSKKPRYYQTEAAKRILKFMRCTEEISTSGGKTLIAYMLFRYMFDKGLVKKFLYVVPNIGLIEQSEDKFYEYDKDCGFEEPPWKSVCIFSGSKKRNEEEANIVFGTYQSLVKKDVSYFQLFDCVFIDETHHSVAASIQTIITKCYNAKWKFGMTGSLPKEGSCASFSIQAYLGPCVYTIDSHQLIEEGNATPVNVIGMELDYLSEKTKKELYDLRNVSADEKDGAKLLNLEKQIAREERKRLLYICNMIAKSSKNSLVLFADIKNSYGRDIYDWLRENTDKTIFYIDGSTDAKNREYYKKRMEDEENVIIVASIGVFSEGIDILHLFNIYIIESSKSEIIVRQILGRGMRLLSGKEKITVIDFSDNFQYGAHKYQKINYLMRHAKIREDIYKEKRFPFKKFKIKIT